MKNKKVSIIWTILLGVFFLYLLYQSAFAWNEQVTSSNKKGDVIPEEKVAFVIVKNTHFLVQNSGIKAVEESLEMWNYDKKREKIILKHENLLPNDKTQMTLIYDRGHDSFERHSEVLSLLRFPYEHYFKGENIFSVNGVNKEGEVYMTYKNQRVHLAAGETYRTFSTEGFKMTVTTIQNYGLYDKKQFVMKDALEREEQAKKDKKPKEIDIQHIEKKPLEATTPDYDVKPVN